MGTIAQKFNYSFEAKDLIKDSINNLGGSITSETELKEYATELDNIYDNLPKTEYQEGSNITLSNTLKGKLDFEDGIVGIGDTSQKSYEGYNLLNPEFESFSSNNVTVTDNQDGTYSFSGTASADTTFVFKRNWQLEDNTTYRITGCPSGGGENTYYIYGINFYNMGREEGNGVNAITGTSAVTLAIRIKSGVNTNGLIFKPMLILGTTAKDFEPYVGNSPSPSPSYPQDIEVVRGKNIFKLENNNTVLNGTTIKITDNSTIELNGTSTDATQYNQNLNDFYLEKGTYTLSSTRSGTSSIAQNIALYSGSSVKAFISYNGSQNTSTFTLNERTQITKISFWITNGTVNTNFKAQIQLEKGSTATSYLPYNTLEVVERGKNLWYSSEYNNTYADLNIKFTNNKVILNGTNSRAVDLRVVDVSNNWNTNSQSILNYINNKNGNYCASNNSGFDTYFYMSSGSYSANTTQVTDSVKVNSIFIRIPINSTFTNKDIEFQLQEGSTATTYEPYQTPQTYQLSLGEYEFAKIGNYVDTIEYDVENDKVYKNKNVNKKVFDDTTFFQYDLTNAVFYYGITNRAVGTETTQNIYCDKLFWNGNFSGVGNTGSMQKYQIACNNNGTSKNIFIKNTDYNATNTFNAWLISINASFYYPLAETVKQEITGTLKDQIKALYYSQSFTGTTIIEINGQLPLIIKVRALKGES